MHCYTVAKYNSSETESDIIISMHAHDNDPHLIQILLQGKEYPMPEENKE
jgi:hypothetical protein